jgi:tetratricopeptide (TPR) repeat protein
MPEKAVEELFAIGAEAVNAGDTVFGLVCFSKLMETTRTPTILSYYAACLAKERGEPQEARSLCEQAIEEEPWNSTLYLNLGRVYLTVGDKYAAIKAFRNGLLHEKNQLIAEELNRIGWRDLPVFTELPREHPLNRYLGKLLKKLGSVSAKSS